MKSHTTGSKDGKWEGRPNLLNHLRNNSHWYLLFIVSNLIIFVYYWFEWHTFTNFVDAVDHDPQFMKDFLSYYYPMSKQILQSSMPIPGYYYTSFFAILLVPIGRLTPLSAMVVWGAIQFICFGILYIVSSRSLLKLNPFGTILFFALGLTAFPTLHNFKWGQVSILITACVMTALLLSSKNKNVFAGILLAIVTAIKFYPALFIIYFILKRNIRACVAFGLATFAFYFAFPATVLGSSNWLAFEKATASLFNNTEWISHDLNSQHIAHVGIRWIAIISNREAGISTIQALTSVGYVIAISCIAMAWLLQQMANCEKYNLSMVAIFLSVPFVIKTSWPHYFVYLPYCQVTVFLYYASSFHLFNRFQKMLSFIPILSMLLSSIFLFNLFPNWELYNSYGILFISNLLLLVSMYAIVAIETGALNIHTQYRV